MRPEDQAYQDRVTRHPGSAYAVLLPDVPDGRRGHVLFDDCITETRTLVDAKNYTAETLRTAQRLGFDLVDELRAQAVRQRGAAGQDWTIEWRVPTAETAEEIRIILSNLSPDPRIKVMVTP
jgi:hypothetical protein